MPEEKTVITKHTPGHWTYGTIGDPTSGAGGQIISGSIHIATCHYGGSKSASWGEFTANSRLIAAAPEMYEALRTISTCSRYTVDQGDDLVFAMDTIRDLAKSAVAKAKGE